MSKAEYKTYNVLQVVNALIDINNENDYKFTLTNLRLQKVLYFLQGFYYVKSKKSLFFEELVAWQYGPVCEEVYFVFKQYGANKITKKFDLINSEKNIIEKNTKEFIKEIFEILDKYSTMELVEFTHIGTPWREAYRVSGSIINRRLLNNYFETNYGKDSFFRE